jgi:hypothetical protein
MKDDLIVAAVGFIVSAIFSWLTFLTFQVFDLSKNQAVIQVRDEQMQKAIETIEEVGDK